MAGTGTRFEPEAFGDDVLFEARKRRLQRGLSLEGDDGLDSFSRKTYRRLEAGDDDALLDEAVRARRSRELGAMGLGETLPEPVAVAPDAREKAHAILGEASQVQGGGRVAPDEGLAEWHARFKMRQAMADKAREEDFWKRGNAARARWARENRSFYQRKADAREERLQAELNRDMLAMRERAFDRALKEREAQRRSLAEMAQAQAARELEREKHERAMELERLRGEQALGLEGLRGEYAYRQAIDVEGLRGENAQALEMHKGENAMKQETLKGENAEKVAQIYGDAQMGVQKLKKPGEERARIESLRKERDSLLQKALQNVLGKEEQTELNRILFGDGSPEEKRKARQELREKAGKSPELALYLLKRAHQISEEIGDPLPDEVYDGILLDGAKLVKMLSPEELARLEAEGVGGEQRRAELLTEGSTAPTPTAPAPEQGTETAPDARSEASKILAWQLANDPRLTEEERARAVEAYRQTGRVPFIAKSSATSAKVKEKPLPKKEDLPKKKETGKWR